MPNTRKRPARPVSDDEDQENLVVEFAGVKSTLPGSSKTRLRAGMFLNQDVLDFFIAKRAKECVEGYTLEVCDTDFYKQLVKSKLLARASNVPDHVNDALTRVNYLGTQHLHPRFFSCSFVFIPVNLNDNHWVLAVVYHRNGTATRVLATIIVFDSRVTSDSAAAHAQIANNLRDFMNCHWCLKHQYGVMTPSRVYTEESCPLTVADIDRQRNGCDCGLYVIKSAEVVMNNASVICSRCSLSDTDLRWLQRFFVDKVVLDGRNARAKLRKELKDMSA